MYICIYIHIYIYIYIYILIYVNPNPSCKQVCVFDEKEEGGAGGGYIGVARLLLAPLLSHRMVPLYPSLSLTHTHTDTQTHTHTSTHKHTHRNTP